MPALIRTLFRSSEYVILFYFTYCSVVAAVRPIDPSIRYMTWIVNTSITALWVLVAIADRRRTTVLYPVIRDWLALAMLILAYREMGWFALPHTSTALEQSWVVWDRLFLDRLHVRAVVELLGPVIPSILEVSYSLVYTFPPFAMAALYLLHRRRYSEELLFPVMTAVLGCYVLFPFFPSEPPRTVFPAQDLPGIMTLPRLFNHWLLGNWGIHTSVFPSAHVAGAFSSAFALHRLVPHRRLLTRTFLIGAWLIALSTVYGRYHYLVDALAGLLLAILAMRLTRLVYGRN